MDTNNSDLKYILLTVVKNEEDNLGKVIDSVVQQTIKPVVWLIVDDCSTDQTALLIKEACTKYGWITSRNLEASSNHDLGLHLATIIRDSFKELISYCNENKIIYNYLANLDGDLVLEKSFFDKLVNEFDSDTTLGIVSGHTRYLINDKLVPDNVNINEPSGGHMMIKSKCFNDCGGIIVSYSWDSVIKAKARMKGWKTKRVIDANVIEVRDVSSAKGYWRGYYYNGKSAYYRNLHPLHIMYKAINYCFKKPYYIGIAYFSGYLNDLLSRKEKIKDDELRNYFRNKHKTRGMNK